MKRSVEGNEMERWLKCRVRRLWNLTTTTWAAWIWVINFGATTWPAESPKNGGSLLWFLVDVSIVNAYILEVSRRNGSRTQLAFLLELVQALLGNFSARRLSVSSGRLEGGHWPISFSKGRCKRCLKNKKLTFCRMGCELCNKRVCLACFKNHTAEDLASTMAPNSKIKAAKT